MKRIGIILGLLIGLVLNSFSAKIIVPDDYATIEAAVAAAVSGDEVYIMNNTYTPASTIIIDGGRDITIRGESANGVIISGATAGRVFSVRGNIFTFLPGSIMHLNRVTIQDASVSGNGGAIEIQSFAQNGSTIDSVIFSNCTASGRGGAIYIDTKLPKISECMFLENSATLDGGAVFYDIKSGGSQNEIINSTFFNNSTSGSGSAVAINQAVGIGLTINNSTFGGHSSSSGSGTIYQNCSEPNASMIIKNTTVANNSDGGIKVNVVASPNLNVQNTLFDNNSVDIEASSVLSVSARGSIIQTFNNITLSASDNILGTHPKPLVVSSLAHFGQFTSSFFLTSYGVAIAVDAAVPGFSNSTGQNGLTRGTPDIGSYEYDESVIYRWEGVDNSWSTASNWSTNQVPPFMSRPEFIIIEKCTNSNVPASTSDLIVPSKLIIRQDGGLDLSGSAYVYVDTLMILSNEKSSTGEIQTGQLKAQIANFAIIGERHIQQFLKGNQWNFLSSIAETAIPVQNLVPGQTFSDDPLDVSGDGDYWVARYDEEERANNGSTGNDWEYVTSGATMAAATGYIVWADRDMRAVFNTYDPNNNKNITTSYTNSARGNSDKGWNLVGNPFICPVDWDFFPNAAGEFDEAMYYYNSQYQTYFTYISGVFDPSSGRGKIPPAQSVFLKSNTDGATMNFTTAMQTIDMASTFYKAQKLEVNELVRLSIHAPDTFFYDVMAIRHKASAKMAYDGKYDGYKLLTFNSIVPQLYTYHLEEDLSVSSVDFEVETNREFPLAFKNLMVDSVYKLAFKLVSNDLGLTYLLEDRETGITHTLKDGDSIEIVSSMADSDSRFILKTRQFVVDIPQKSVNNMVIYSQTRRINVNFGGDQFNGQVLLYDISGKIVNSEVLTGFSGNFVFDNLNNGVYIVKCMSENKNVTEKIVVR